MFEKKVNFDITTSHNYETLIRGFCNQAKLEGWTIDEISAVVDEASSDFDNYLYVLESHCEYKG